jgi:hypothetical protein
MKYSLHLGNVHTSLANGISPLVPLLLLHLLLPLLLSQ